MKEKLFITVASFLFCISTFAQKPEMVYYNKSWGLLGSTETLLIPDNSGYLLQRIYLGKLAGSTIDTLQIKEGKLKGKKFEVSLTDKRMALHFTGKDSWKKNLKFKEFDSCSTFVNQRQNSYYSWNLHYDLEQSAKKKLGNSNAKWENRPKHDLEVFSVNSVKSDKSIFSRMCHEEFKQIADSVYKSNYALLNDIALGERN
ncbi:hypothetical protein [Rufibacter sp. XAAS-G3-1]|uniref:hypothetical protein n=1 Tax=Rufibacter sp. XAAS-G3-1 TaxID=2729134 RepID=UPI0015E708FA|nr:hypothetical protein [Rufibacter sp. XAAS-G3-1]